MKEDKAKGVKVVAPGGSLLAIGRIEASFVCRAGVGAVSVACANRRTLACEGGCGLLQASTLPLIGFC